MNKVVIVVVVFPASIADWVVVSGGRTLVVVAVWVSMEVVARLLIRVVVGGVLDCVDELLVPVKLVPGSLPVGTTDPVVVLPSGAFVVDIFIPGTFPIDMF